MTYVNIKLMISPINMGTYRPKGFGKEYHLCHGIPHYLNPVKQSRNVKKIINICAIILYN